MGQKLTGQRQNGEAERINGKEQPFRIVLSTKLENNYEFKDLKERDIKEFHHFLRETVYKKLSITTVERDWLRQKGDAPPDFYQGGIEMIHLGKSASKFRLFGYYDINGCFVLCKIDPGHNTHS